MLGSVESFLVILVVFVAIVLEHRPAFFCRIFAPLNQLVGAHIGIRSRCLLSLTLRHSRARLRIRLTLGASHRRAIKLAPGNSSSQRYTARSLKHSDSVSLPFGKLAC